MSRESVYLRHILEALEKIERYTAVGRKEFFENAHWQDATIRQFEVIVEAVKRLSQRPRGAEARDSLAGHRWHA